MLESLIRLEKDAHLLEKAKETALEMIQNPKMSKAMDAELQYRAWTLEEDDLMASG
jgi:hypothetical protein